MRVLTNSLGGLAMAMTLVFAAGPGFAVELGDCGHPVPHRSILGCSALIERGGGSPDRVAEWLLLRGTAFLINGDTDRAIADLDQTIRIAPNSPAAFVARGDAYRRKGQIERARADYDQAVRIDPNYIEAYLARSEGEVGQRPEWDKLSHFSFEAVMAAISRRVHVGRMDEHKQHVERTLAGLDEAIRRNPTDAGAYVKRGRAFLSFGERQSVRAMADYDAAIGVDPNHAEAYTARAFLHRARRKWDLAIADTSEALRLQPRNATAYSSRGIAYREKGDYDRAIADFGEAIRPVPNNGGLYHSRGLAHEKNGNREKAISDYRKVLEFGHSPLVNASRAPAQEGLKRLGLSDRERRDWEIEATIARYDQMIRENPNNPAAYGIRCLSYRNKGDYGRAIADCDQAIRLAPNVAAPCANRGEVYLAKGDLEAAIADFDQAIRVDPKSFKGYADRASVSFKKGEYDRAIADLDEAIRLQPKFAKTYADRGLAYERKSERDNAIADYRRAREVHQSNTKDPAFPPSVEGLKRLGAAP